MWEWILKNRFTILVGTAALLAGFFLNKLANRISEDRIIAALTAEIESIKNKTRITSAEQTRLIELQAQINLLKLK